MQHLPLKLFILISSIWLIYIHLFLEEGDELTLSEDRPVPLVTEVIHYVPFLVLFSKYILISFHPSYSIFHPLFRLYRNMPSRPYQVEVDLLHAYAFQQLQVALLGLPAAEVIDLLSDGLVQARPVTEAASAQPHPCAYTSTPPAPPPASVWIVGVSEFSHIPAVPTIELKSNEETTPVKTKTSDDFVPISKCHGITTTVISLSVSATPSTSAISFPVVVVPKLAIPGEAYLECLNRPGGGKDYL